MLLWSLLLLLLHQTPGETVRADFSRLLKNESLAKAFYENHSKSKDKVVLGYAAAARCISAGTYFNPYSKYSEFKSGTEVLDTLIKQFPSEPELRYQRLLIQLFSPSFLGYNDNITEDLRALCKSLPEYKACDLKYKLEMIGHLDPKVTESTQKLLLQQCKLSIRK